MELSLTSWLSTDRLEGMLAIPFAEVWLAIAILGLSASIYATGIPGVLLPVSFSSGALLGGALGMSVVTTGALCGSIVLYLIFERSAQATLRKKYGDRFMRLDHLASPKGIISIVGLRFAGAPHVAVTAFCALARIGTQRYALATTIGISPSIAISAAAGASL